MKHCPKCKKSYDQVSMTFCLDDGMPLIEADQNAETLILQNFDGQRLHQTLYKDVSILIGDYYEFQFSHHVFRIEVRDVLLSPRYHITAKFRGWTGAMHLGQTPPPLQNTNVAQIYINTGGGLIFGGERTLEVSTNEYYVPATKPSENEELSSLYFWQISNERFKFGRLVVNHLNTHVKRADLNIYIISLASS